MDWIKFVKQNKNKVLPNSLAGIARITRQVIAMQYGKNRSRTIAGWFYG